jgi:hypothetical protein
VTRSRRFEILNDAQPRLAAVNSRDDHQASRLEAAITMLIELTWSKQRILEVYLNIAEFGRRTLVCRGGEPALLAQERRAPDAGRRGTARRRVAESPSDAPDARGRRLFSASGTF